MTEVHSVRVPPASRAVLLALRAAARAKTLADLPADGVADAVAQVLGVQRSDLPAVIRLVRKPRTVRGL